MNAFPPFRLDSVNQCLLRRRDTGDDERIRLTPKAFAVLQYLVENAGRLVTQEELLNSLWPDTFVQPEVLKSHILDVRSALGDDAKHPKFIQTHAKRGYEFIAPVLDESAAMDMARESPMQKLASEEGRLAPERDEGGTRLSVKEGKPHAKRRLVAIVAVVVALIGIVGYAGFRGWFRGLGAKPQFRSIAILPLENLSGDPKQDYLADGMTEELTVDLGQVSALRVTSRTSAMNYRNSKKSAPDIARELNVDGIVEGSVVREGNEVRITAQLIDAKSDHHVWARSYTRGIGSILTLQREVAQEIADAISIEVSPQEKARLQRTSNVDIEAQDLYLLGAHLVSVGDPQQAREYFQKAIEKDQNFAQAYAALSHTYALLGGDGLIPYMEAFSKAKASAIKAIELDEGLSDGHLALADAVANLDWDWETQERELKRALELNPSGASAHWSYAFALEKLGRTDEALIQLRIMQQLDPVSSQSAAETVEAEYYARHYDSAMDHLRRLDAANPQRVLLGFWFGVINREKGLYQDSVRAFLTVGDHPHALGHMGNAYARWGRVTEARALIPRLQDHIHKNGIGTYEISLIYAGLGDKDSAFEWLEKASVVRDKGLTFLKVDPCLDPLRSDPRFLELLRRVGFPL
ncbi:MAG TPA: winged helix-turn-helix domain-containing protein [Candidatus Solibacter sp.]|nr:winged helix-turn-helix domain-containing protein [Candidatus Solibacter sp.]